MQSSGMIADLELKIKRLYEEIFNLNEEVMSKAQRINSLEEKNKILTIENDHFNR